MSNEISKQDENNQNNITSVALNTSNKYEDADMKRNIDKKFSKRKKVGLRKMSTTKYLFNSAQNIPTMERMPIHKTVNVEKLDTESTADNGSMQEPVDTPGKFVLKSKTVIYAKSSLYIFDYK